MSTPEEYAQAFRRKSQECLGQLEKNEGHYYDGLEIREKADMFIAIAEVFEGMCKS